MSDPKTIVAQAYDSLADWYLTWIDHQPSPRERYAKKVLENLHQTSPSPSPSSPYILELGCGPGVPITRLLLSHGARVLANDISPNQISLAKTQCSTSSNDIEFIASDMTLLTLPPNTLDGVVCFFTLFHLPRSEQKTMLAKILTWLKPGGLLVINFATVDEEEIYGEMMGHGIFWSSFPVDLNRAMVEEVGFEVEVEEVLASEADGGNEFQWMAARKGRGKVVESGEVKL